MDVSDNEGVTVDPNSLAMKWDGKRTGFTLRTFSPSGATEVLIPSSVLRYTNPKTGARMKAPHLDKRANRIATVCERKGSYGYAVTWGNNATIIYSLKAVMEAAEEAERGGGGGER